MNKSIITNNGSKSQSNKLKKQKTEEERIGRMELNIERFGINGAFCTTGSKEVGLEYERIIDLGTEVSEQGISAKKMTITPSAKYGYPTVGALEVLEGLIFLHNQQENPNTDIVKIPSIKYFITKILRQKYSKKARDAFYEHLSQLFDTGFGLEYAFYSKDDGNYIKNITKFHFLESWNIQERRDSKVVRDFSTVRINKFVFDNIKLGYTKPLFIDAAFKIRSEMGKLLYRMLCFHFSYHDKFEYSTKKIFEQLRLKGKGYHKPSVRRDFLERAITQIINLPISLHKIVSNYRFEKTADDSDWKLIVFCKKNPNKIDSISKNQEALPEPQNKASDDVILHQPIVEGGQEKEPLRTQNKADLEHISKSIKIEPQKLESGLSGKEELSDIDIFLKLHSEKFPNVKPASKASPKVRNKVGEFLSIYSLEQGKDFLEFCLELGRQEQYEKILNGQTANYLIDYKIGDQLVIDAWIQDRGRKRQLQEQRARTERETNINTYLDFEKAYFPAYTKYLKNHYVSLTEEQKAEYETYLNTKIENRLKNIKSSIRKEQLTQKIRTNPLEIQPIYRSFCKEKTIRAIFSFEQWAEIHHPEAYSKVKEYEKHFGNNSEG
jgi:hypothetical protein